VPYQAPRICSHAGCHCLVNNGSRCINHQIISGWYATEQSKGNRHKRGYGAKWDKLRLRILQRDNYLCLPCKQAGVLTAAKQVDHIIAKANGGGDNEVNLQSICITCHRLKTLKEAGKN